MLLKISLAIFLKSCWKYTVEKIHPLFVQNHLVLLENEKYDYIIQHIIGCCNADSRHHPDDPNDFPLASFANIKLAHGDEIIVVKLGQQMDYISGIHDLKQLLSMLHLSFQVGQKHL